MHGTGVKIIETQGPKIYNKNTMLKLLKTNAAIWFNKISGGGGEANDAKIIQHQNQRKKQTKQEHQTSWRMTR